VAGLGSTDVDSVDGFTAMIGVLEGPVKIMYRFTAKLIALDG
jgi:hypothetical protein